MPEVIARLIVGGIVWLGIMILFGAALDSPAPPRAGPPWRITQSRTAHHAMIVDVTAPRVADARTIAAGIVGSARGRAYEEVLVYVRGAGEHGGPAERRVQWTPAGGFVELVIRE